MMSAGSQNEVIVLTFRPPVVGQMGSRSVPSVMVAREYLGWEEAPSSCSSVQGRHHRHLAKA